MGYKVSESEFKNIKFKLWLNNPAYVAGLVDRSLAVVLKVKACKDYQEYVKLVKAEHPPQRKNSLRDELDYLKNQVDTLKEAFERYKTATALALSKGDTHDCD